MGECIFCKIAEKREENTVIEYESETIVIFKDIRPASDFHFLAVSKVHIKDIKSLDKGHLPLCESIHCI